MDENLRKNIQKTATKLFLKYGLRSVSIDDICNELRISKKTFYTQFGQKEELIDSVLMEHNEKRFKKQENIVHPCSFSGNAIDSLCAMTTFHLSKKNRQFVSFFFDLNKYYPEIHKRHAQLNHEKACEQIKKNIIKGIDEGLYRTNFDLDLMTRYLAMQFMNMLDMSPEDSNRSDYKKSFELMMDVYIRILSNRVGLDYYENLMCKKTQEIPVEEEAMKDEELDLVIEKFFNN